MCNINLLYVKLETTLPIYFLAVYLKKILNGIAKVTHFSVRGTACIRGLYSTSCRSQQPCISRPIQDPPSRIVGCILPRLCWGWTFLQGSGRLQYWQCSAIFKKYLHCVLAARILTVDFVVCTLAVKKKNQGRFRYVGSDHSLV
jgi:hypothetical protein